MAKKDINTEQAILKAAEEEFLEKGFERTKTTVIAKKAGVNHAMLHYYFRTKENLFNMVFEQKAQLLADSISEAFDSELPLFEKLRKGIEAHFDFLSYNPRLPFFVYNEIICDDQRQQLFMTSFLPRINMVMSKLEQGIQLEAKKGTVRPIKALDLILNIVSLNIFPFLGVSLVNILLEDNHENYTEFLKRRKESNVDLILHSIML